MGTVHSSAPGGGGNYSRRPDRSVLGNLPSPRTIEKKTDVKVTRSVLSSFDHRSENNAPHGERAHAADACGVCEKESATKCTAMAISSSSSRASVPRTSHCSMLIATAKKTGVTTTTGGQDVAVALYRTSGHRATYGCRRPTPRLTQHANSGPNASTWVPPVGVGPHP